MPGPHVHDFEPLLAGASPARERLEALIERIASTPRTTALVRGERGAPLAAAARLIHARSARSGRPCVVLRASDSLGEGFAERLHGERGALGAAAGGTLILHEVHELADDAQRALLGELTDASFDVRVVATSSAERLKAKMSKACAGRWVSTLNRVNASRRSSASRSTHGA